MLENGEVVDRYTVEEVLGQGGMAVVYRVRHNQLDSHHALKILTITNPGIKDRLLQEGKVQASLRHPNIVAVTDVLEVRGAPGLVMEFIEGPGLDVWLQQNQPTLEQSVAIFEAVCLGVAHAHDKGVVHRDLKPANVMMAPASGSWVPKVADFGLAKAATEDGSMQKTRSGVTMGTPQYMAPEQIRDAKSVDQRADVFSLGCILYELVCGRPPFVGPDILSIFNAVASGSYPSAISFAPDLPAGVRDAIEGALVVDKESRIPTVAMLLEVVRGAPLPEAAAAASMARASGAEVTWPQASGGPGMGVASVPRASAPATSAPSGSLAPPSGSSSLSSLAPRGRRVSFMAGAALVGVGLLGGVGILAVAGGALFASHSVESTVREALAKHGDFAVGDVAFGPTGLELSDFAIDGPDGKPVVRVASVRLEANPAAFAGEEWSVSRVVLSGVSGDLRRGADGRFHLSASTESMLRAGAAFGLSADEVVVEGGTVSLTSDGGSLSVEWDGASLRDFSLALDGGMAWTAASGSLTGLDVGAADPVLRIGSVAVEGGRADLAEVELWVRGRTDGMLDLAPVLADEIADWAGGTRHEPESRPWLGIDLSGWPVAMTEVQASSGVLHLSERAHGVKTASWDVALDRLSVGPVGPDRVPFGLSGTLGDGRVTADGDVSASGLIRASAAARYVPMDAFEAYSQTSLSHYGMRPGGGTVDLVANLTVQGNTFAAVVDVSGAEIRFDATPEATGKGRRLLSPRAKVERAVDLEFNLASQRSEPLGKVIYELVDMLFEPAGGAVVDQEREASRARVRRKAEQELADARAAAEPDAGAGVVPQPQPEPTNSGQATRGSTEPEPEGEAVAPVPEAENNAEEVTEEVDAPEEEQEKRDAAETWKRVNTGVRDALDDFRIRKR